MKAIISAKRARALAINVSSDKLKAIEPTFSSHHAQLVTVCQLHTPLCRLLGESCAKSEAEDCDYESGECLLFVGFNPDELEELLDELALCEKSKQVKLKAIYTPHNRTWTAARLIKELEQEHIQMSGSEEDRQ
ncbi:MAG: DUF3783 domain-containing protein [Ruminococcus sp.]|nr:DUF3783 domain-containing protein [Ruminococcus sp.]